MVISDIHANRHALHADLEKEARDGLISAGDAVDFGPDPNNCIGFLINSSQKRFWRLTPRLRLEGVLRARQGRRSLHNKVSYDIEKTVKDIEKSTLPYEAKGRPISILVAGAVITQTIHQTNLHRPGLFSPSHNYIITISGHIRFQENQGKRIYLNNVCF